MNTAVSFSNVNKSFGEQVGVRDLSFELPADKITGIIGPNGSGKTTTLRLTLNIYNPDSGEVRVLDTVQSRAANDAIGYLPEERGLYRSMRVYQQLEYIAKLKSMPRKEIRGAIKDWLERFGLWEKRKKKVEQLSKGMAQKIQFIAAVMFRPKLLILDEPFSGLDPVNLDLMTQVIYELKAAGTTILLSTHDMATAERMCDRVVMIYKGDKVLDGEIQSIREEFGQDRIKVQLQGGREVLERVEGVEQIHEADRFYEVLYNGDPQAFLANISAEAKVTYFEVAHPSLHDIFVRIANPETEDVV